MAEPKLISHLEQHLGPIAGGVPIDLARGGPKLHIVAFDEGPFANTKCYCTLGLSHHRLRDPRTNRTFRMELLMMLRGGDETADARSPLADVAEQMTAHHEPLLCGDVLGPRGPLWSGTRLEALYVASPVYLPDEFAGVDLEDGDRCVIAWLVPITANECAYVRSHGHAAFEEKLVVEDPDLLARDRSDIALG